MAAILRVKRRNDENPLEALLIACKRRKTVPVNETDEIPGDSVTAVLKFAGTVQNQDESVVEHLGKTFTKEELIANFKKHTVSVTDKAREQTKEDSRQSRFKVVNCVRAIDCKDDSVCDSIDKDVTVIDVEDTMQCSPQRDPVTSKNQDYVYDLYYAPTGDDMLIDQMVSVHPFQEDLVFDAYRDNDHDEASEDSNSEGNWRNDYPDSDHSENSVQEEDMRRAVARMRVDSDDESSSEDEDFVYGLSEEDVQNFGYKYAKYKAKIKGEMEPDEENGEEDISHTDSENSECEDYQ